MKITKQWLFSSPKFFSQLAFVLYGTSPYFGKLGWKLNPLFGKNWPWMEVDIDLIEDIKENIPDEANEAQICRILMTNIFKVAPDYNRTQVSTPTYEYDEFEKAEMERHGWERLPKYPAYHVHTAPSDYRPLKEEEIEEYDIQKFKQKIYLVGSPDAKQLLAEYKTLRTLFGSWQTKVKQQLTNWIKLINNGLESRARSS